MNNKKSGFNWVFTTILLVLSVLVLFSFVDISPKIDEAPQSQIIQLIKEGKVESIYGIGGEGYILLVESESKIKGENRDDFPSQADYSFIYNDSIMTEIINIIEADTYAYTVAYAFNPAQASIFETLLPILYILSGLLLIYFVFRMFSKSNSSAMSFGKNKARLSQNIKVRFSDIAGADEEKEELAEIVEFLKSPAKFTELGARIPKGVLLVGNPGTGKTLLARAVAGESNVPFLSISGSDFVEMFVGVGASRVRDLFDQAKKVQPCIVFIDEIDAVGRQRGAGLGGGNDEREQTLNQLLVEMDGFAANEGIIILAATNRSDVLDPALLRPGRFDRQIYVHAPDVKGREGIIRIHARNKKIADDIDFQTLARITSGFTGADIENMLNEAAIISARNNRTKIIMQDIQEGINKVIMGPQKKSLLITENDKIITAYHESGHAIVGKLLENCEEVQEVSIIPRGNAAGYTMSRPDNDDHHMGKKKLCDTIAMMMGGRIAEELYMKDISTGASNDIKRATEIARKMVTAWGMSDKFGFMGFDSSEEIFVGRQYQSKNEYSETTAALIDVEVKHILDKNYEVAKKILAANKNVVKEMSELLLAKNTIYKEEVDMLLSGKKKEEVIVYMEEQEQIRKNNEEKFKRDAEREKKIKEIELRVQTAKMYLKENIISQSDFDAIIKERDEAIKKLGEENTAENKLENTKAQSAKTDESVKTKKVTVKKVEKADSETKKVTAKKSGVSKEKKEKKDEKKD